MIQVANCVGRGAPRRLEGRETKEKHICPPLLCLGTFALCLLALWLLLLAAAAIPNEAIRANAERTALSYRDKEAFALPESGRWNAIQDNYADAILWNVAWHMGEGDPLRASLDTRYYDGGELGENAGLYLAVTQGTPPNTDYSRYWHGSALLLRPLLLITDGEHIKLLGFAVILALLALTAVLLGRRGHWDLAAALALSFAAVQGWELRLSLEYQPAFWVALALCPLYLRAEGRSQRALALLSVVSGAATAFFDFLTTETVPLLLPLLLVTALRAKEGRLRPLRRELLGLGQCFLAWGGAYAGAFLVKWSAASLVAGENKFTLALSSAAERFGGEGPDNFLSPLSANLTALFGGTARSQPLRAVLGLALVLLAAGSVFYLLHGRGKGRGVGVLLLLGAAVFLRYLVLGNHSYLHCFFTYRAMLCPIFALLAGLALQLPKGRDGP